MNATVPDMESIIERVREGIRRGQFTLHEVQETVTDRSSDMARRADDYIHEHPWTAIAVGAGLGLGAGMLLMGIDKFGKRPAKETKEKRSARELLQSSVMFALAATKAIQAFRRLRF